MRLIENTKRWATEEPRAGRRWLIAAAVLAAVALVLGAWLVARGRAAASRLAPEADQVRSLEATMPFQILIPAYLPKGFDRAGVEIDVRPIGPGGQPMVQLTYHSSRGTPLFIREWLPGDADAEILAASRMIYTKWGSGWMLGGDEGMLAIWVDVGALRAGLYAPNQDVVSPETLLAIADTLGPAANRQVSDVLTRRAEVREVIPPPLEIPVSASGVQEVDLIVSASGYSPAHFAVRKGIPVQVTFRQLGWVGCGSEITFPTGPGESVELSLESPADKKVIAFTPQVAGEFQFSCTHMTYKGVLTVRE